MSGDGGTQIVQRINKRDLLRRIEALDREVQQLKAQIATRAPGPLPDIGRVLVGTPPLWPYHPYPLGPAVAGGCVSARTGTSLMGGPHNDTRLENLQ